MGKDGGGFLTAKAIGKRIKSKGLGKLKFYCQMCEKQCRDANGYKCHLQTENHQRKMLLLASNQNEFLDTFSKQFHEGMMDVIGRRFRNSRVLANAAYNEYIRDPHHAHMTATKWVTLGAYVKFIGKEGLVTVEDTPQGLYVRFIDRDLESRRRQGVGAGTGTSGSAGAGASLTEDDKLQAEMERRAGHVRSELDRRKKEFILDEKERGKGIGSGINSNTDGEAEDSKFVAAGPIAFSLGDVNTRRTMSRKRGGSAASDSSIAILSTAEAPTAPVSVLDDKQHAQEPDHKRRRQWDAAPNARESTAASIHSSICRGTRPGKKVSALEEIRRLEEARKDAEQRKENWLFAGIVVKYVDDSLAGGRFFNEKGVVERVLDDDEFCGVVKMIKSGAILQVDQDMLETVIPAVGGAVRVVNGAYRGAAATLVRVDSANFKAYIRLENGTHTGDEVALEYEDICKLDE